MILKCENLSKSFLRNPIFKNLSFEISSGSSLAITGSNGSGKSTLVKTLCGLIQPDKGKVTLTENEIIPSEKHFLHMSLVAPYINLYDELTGSENLEFFYNLKSSFTNKAFTREKADEELHRVGLFEKRNEQLKNYSSGMKQRLKVAFSILNEPEVLFMDEPGTNLDSSGKEIIYNIAEEQKTKGILIIATNDSDESGLCERKIDIEEYKPKKN